jgi:hypothetical protein
MILVPAERWNGARDRGPMGTIINLYVFPASTAAPSALGPLVRRLVAESWIELPAVAGPPMREPPLYGVQSPAALTLPGSNAIRHVRNVPALDAELKRAETEPVLLAFAALNPNHPDVRRDFDHYRGFECAVGFYAFPAGYRVKLVWEDLLGGGGSGTAFDRTVRCWCQLNGKAAIWESLFRGSALERLFQAVWPEHEVVENDWL